ncbi:MAG: hypothetical protein JWM78_3602 [Verrucomicrobiaceae bacterium]|nr:hypothetical protein [Verrucomicrobiaceae bacterium]
MRKITVLVGSLREGSNSGKLAKALEKLSAEHFEFHYPDLNLPLYNEDLWKNPPASVLKLKADLAATDAVLFVTPEYNRSIPPVIKNVIDWGSRPWGQSSWKNKPVGIVGSSPGAVGSAAAQSHLRSILVTQDVFLLGAPEVYFVFKPDSIDDQGTVADEGSKKFLKSYTDRFAQWIEIVSK